MLQNLYLKLANLKYQKSVKTLNEIADQIKNYLPDFNEEVLIKAFDFALESTLLKEAISDKKISLEEIEFLKMLFKNGNVLELLQNNTNSLFIKSLKLEDIVVLSPDEQEILIDTLKDLTKDYVEVVSIGLGIVDALTIKNYYKSLSRNVYSILVLFALIDGKKDKKEIEDATNEFIELFAYSYVSSKEYTKDLVKTGKEIKKYISKDVKKLKKEINKYLLTHSDEEIEEDINSLLNEVLKDIETEVQEIK